MKKTSETIEQINKLAVEYNKVIIEVNYARAEYEELCERGVGIDTEDEDLKRIKKAERKLEKASEKCNKIVEQITKPLFLKYLKDVGIYGKYVAFLPKDGDAEKYSNDDWYPTKRYMGPYGVVGPIKPYNEDDPSSSYITHYPEASCYFCGDGIMFEVNENGEKVFIEPDPNEGNMVQLPYYKVNENGVPQFIHYPFVIFNKMGRIKILEKEEFDKMVEKLKKEKEQICE